MPFSVFPGLYPGSVELLHGEKDPNRKAILFIVKVENLRLKETN